jgi:iron complex transport system permease protein
VADARPLFLLGAGAAVAIAAFMTVGLRGDIVFAMELRVTRLLALVQVAVAIALSTVVFQTVTANRILTPSIMGMDALYVLIQTTLVMTLGGIGFAALDPSAKFAGETAMMALLALGLFLPMLKMRSDLTLLLLAGVVLGVLFRSLNALLARMIDPNAFAVAQGASFADFNTVREDLVLPALVLTALAAIFIWRRRHVLDIMALGTASAIGLGVSWRAEAALMLVVTGLLVAVSTALVGPVTFLGLLVVAMAERITGTRRHGPLLPAAALTAVIVLVGGQTVLQHGFSNAVTLGVVIEFAGGIVFLCLLFAARPK